jgi:hypothetical protein
VSNIEDTEIDEVVGDSEGDDIAAVAAPDTEPAAPAEPPAEPAPPAEPEDEESKAIEAFLAAAGL